MKTRKRTVGLAKEIADFLRGRRSIPRAEFLKKFPTASTNLLSVLGELEYLERGRSMASNLAFKAGSEARLALQRERKLEKMRAEVARLEALTNGAR